MTATLHGVYKHRLKPHLEDYRGSHCQMVLEEALKIYPRTLSQEDLPKVGIIISKMPSHAPKDASLHLTIYFPSSFFIWFQREIRVITCHLHYHLNYFPHVVPTSFLNSPLQASRKC